MAARIERTPNRPLHPLHAILLAFPVALFVGALLSDWAYSASYQVQWTNFSSWLIAGALFFGAFALLWALIDWFRAGSARSGRLTLYLRLLGATWLLGLLNAFIHAKDAWAVMPEGFMLSIIVALLALAAAWVGYSAPLRHHIAREVRT